MIFTKKTSIIGRKDIFNKKQKLHLRRFLEINLPQLLILKTFKFFLQKKPMFSQKKTKFRRFWEILLIQSQYTTILQQISEKN